MTDESLRDLKRDCGMLIGLINIFNLIQVCDVINMKRGTVLIMNAIAVVAGIVMSWCGGQIKKNEEKLKSDK